MSRYCENCVKPFTHTNHNIDKPDFFDIDKIYNDYITNQNEKNLI